MLFKDAQRWGNSPPQDVWPEALKMIRAPVKKETVKVSDKHCRNSVGKTCQNTDIVGNLKLLNRPDLRL